MKQYETYKDSGIQWLGKIPSHWETCPLKFNLSLKGRIGWNGLKSDEFKEESFAYLVTGQDFDKADIDWSKCYQIDKERYDEDPFIQLSNGDLLVTKDGTIGKVAKVSNLDKPACLNSGIFVVKQIKSAYIQDFLYWTFVSNQLVDFNNFNSSGSTIQHLYQNVFENMPLLVPSIVEQQAIASYLDYKVGQIDAAIKEKEAILEDLKAYRTAIISEAVTKGLDKNVPMKDSGYSTIGSIPATWRINKLKFFSSIQTGTTPSTSVESYWNNPTENWFTPSDFADDDIHLFESSRKVSDVAFSEESCRVFPINTVLVVGIGATLGKVGISGSICSANQQVNAITFKNEVIPLYGAYFLCSIREIMRSVANAATLAIMNQSVTGELPFVCPPIEEQYKIVDVIEKKASEIKNTIQEIQSQIDDLKSYKSSVISEAVTGKVDLRDWKPKTVTA